MVSMYPIAIAIFSPILMAFVIQKLIVIPRLRKELLDLNERRGERVQQALASASIPTWNSSHSEPRYSFSGWVDLNSDGFISVAGRKFTCRDSFEVTAKDESHLPRARVQCNGLGVILIFSHGQTYGATYRDGHWDVRKTDQ